jgi:tetratricopeptide (TPR) repeat protein
MAVRAAEGLDGRLKAIEQSLASQRSVEVQAVQNSNRVMLLLGGMFAAIALIAMFLMAFFQWRTINRLAEISATASAGGFAFGSGRPVAALGPGDVHSVTVAPVEHQNPGAAERARAGLLSAVERLEKRIHELEHTAQPPLNEPKSDGPATEPKTDATSNELKTDSAASDLNSGSSASEIKTDSSNGDRDLASPSPEPKAIASEQEGASLTNDFAKSPAPNDILTDTPTHVNSENGAPIPAQPVTAAETGRITGLIGKGQSLLNVDKAEEALACFDEVLTLDAQNAEALVKKGTALERLRKLEEAIECYNRAIVADGSMTIAYLYKGGLFNRLERFTEAMECYEQALRTQEKRRG